MIAVSINLWNHGRKHDFGWTLSISVPLSTRLRDEHSLRQLLTTTVHFIYVYIFTFQWGPASERCDLVRFKAVCTCIIYHGPFARYVKLWVAHAQGTFSPPPTSILRIRQEVHDRRKNDGEHRGKLINVDIYRSLITNESRGSKLIKMSNIIKDHALIIHGVALNLFILI